MMKHLLALLLVSLSFNAQTQTTEIRGRVFEDRNGNTLLDQEEEGIPNVSVSDQVSTTITDQNGQFSLTTGDDFPYVFISQPSGYAGTWYYQKASEVNFPLQQSDPQQHLIEFRIIYRQSKQREDCFQKAVIKRGLRRMRRSALRARSLSSP